ncbi:MAG TPA: GAF domain-containing sensor histidine kinase [Planctomycetota bacterium]|nr:GAF domain-containing sensor histidine kinase [Planctomycetota bacterium]
MKFRWAYLLMILPTLTDCLETGRLPSTPREYITEVVLAIVVGACVRMIYSQEEGILARTAWLNLLSDVASSSNEADTVDQAFRFATRRICQEGVWSICQVYVPKGSPPTAVLPASPLFFDARGPRPALKEAVDALRFDVGKGLVGRVLERGETDWVSDVRTDPVLSGSEALVQSGTTSALAFPIKIGRETAAVFLCLSPRPFKGAQDVLHYLSVVGVELGRAIERKRLQEDYTEAVWTEQRRIARELHDSLGQELTGLGYMANSLSETLSGSEESKNAERITHGIARALDQIRGIARGLLPVELEADGLMSALAELADQTRTIYGIPVRFDCTKPALVKDGDVALHLFRIAQEAVTNAVKHGRPKWVTITLEGQSEGILLSIRDDGVGPAGRGPVNQGSGLRIMKYRASTIGATLTVQAADGGGMLVTCTLPSTTGVPRG